MPEPYYKARPYRGQVYQLRHAAAAGSSWSSSATCAAVAPPTWPQISLPSWGRYRDALWPPFPCSKGGSLGQPHGFLQIRGSQRRTVV